MALAFLPKKFPRLPLTVMSTSLNWIFHYNKKITFLTIPLDQKMVINIEKPDFLSGLLFTVRESLLNRGSLILKDF